jgi:hypothetical protein
VEKNLKLTCELGSGAEKTALIKFNAQHWLRLLRSLVCVVLMAVGFCGSAHACSPVVSDGGNNINAGPAALLLNRTSGFGNVVYQRTVNIDFTSCNTVSSINTAGITAFIISKAQSVSTLLVGTSNSQPFEPDCQNVLVENCTGGRASLSGLNIEHLFSTAGITGTGCTVTSNSQNTAIKSTTGVTFAISGSCTQRVLTSTVVVKRSSRSVASSFISGDLIKHGFMQISLISGTSVIATVDATAQLGIPKRFTYATPTCSIDMPKKIDLGGVAADTVQKVTTGNQVGTWQNITISLNCSDASSFDKLFTWTFAKPAADALSMLNDGGSATGVSAQIRVNTDLTNADGSTNSSRIINSGLTYEGLLKGSVAITPIYSVGFIRNGEAVSAGSFSSNATLSVNYR